ncbi:MAG: hypothetical protein R3Y04_05150 [Rikenellaceae bacterium]
MNNSTLIKISKIVSLIFHPAIIIVYLLLALLFGNTYLNSGSASLRLRIILTLHIALLTVILPILIIQIYKACEKYFNIKFLHNYKRHASLLIVAICYIMVMFITMPVLGTYFAQKLFLTTAVILTMANAITLITPLSLHMLALSIATTMLWTLHFFGYGQLMTFALIAIFISGLVASSRLMLQKSSLSEISYSYLIGVLAMLLLLFI